MIQSTPNMDLDLSKPLENDFNPDTATEDKEDLTSVVHSNTPSELSRPPSLRGLELEVYDDGRLSVPELKERARAAVNEVSSINFRHQEEMASVCKHVLRSASHLHRSRIIRQSNMCPYPRNAHI